MTFAIRNSDCIKQRRDPQVQDPVVTSVIESSDEKIQIKLQQLCGFLIMPSERRFRPYSYPLMYFAGVLTITPSQSYTPVEQYTSHLAGLLWTTCALFLQLNLPENTITQETPSDA